nr:unnamed protein product [Callosobruchus chinensis]
MLRSINNNQSPFSMDNLLSTGKISPENLDLKRDEDLHHIIKRSPSPVANARQEEEEDRLSPALANDRNEMFLRFNSCLRNRICSNCGRLDCNFIHCRFGDSIKDSKPVLKFSVSAILGDEKIQPRNNNCVSNPVNGTQSTAVFPLPGTFPWAHSGRGKPRRGMMRRAVKIWFQNRRMKWRNSKERELLAAGGSREQTLPNKNNPHPDLSDADGDRPKLDLADSGVISPPQSPTPANGNVGEGKESSATAATAMYRSQYEASMEYDSENDSDEEINIGQTFEKYQ